MKNLNKIRGKREFYFDDKDLIALGVCSLLLILLTFWLGVLVGKGSQLDEVIQMGESSALTLSPSDDTSTTQHIQVAPEENSKQESIQTTNPPRPDEPKQDLKLSYYTVLQDAEQSTEQGIKQPEAGVDSPPIDSESREVKSGSSQGEIMSEGPRIKAPGSGRSDSLPEVPSRKPEGPLKIASGSGSGVYSVQVISSPSRGESEALRDQFREKGYDASVTSIDLGTQGIWYRVRVGNLATRAEAELLKKELQERFSLTVKDPFIVKAVE